MRTYYGLPTPAGRAGDHSVVQTMKPSKRHRTVQPSADDIEFMAGLYVQFEETVAAYRRLSEAHASGANTEEIGPEALAWARAAALILLYADAVMNDPSEPLLATLAQSLSEGCVMAMGVLGRLCCALCALAEEDVVQEALLRADELDELVGLDSLTDWLAFNRNGIEGAVANGHRPPGRLISPQILDIPYVKGGMNELRELLLTREVPDLEALRQEADAPPGGPRAEGFYFAGLFNAVLTLVVYHGSLYLELLRETEEHGPSAEIDAAAIQASVDVALVQQSIWQRREMIGAVRDTPLDLVPAMGILDALIFSLLALTGRDERCALARLDAERLEARLRAKALLDWVEATGYDRALPADGVATLCQAREEGANEEELIEMTWETIGRALAASD